MIGAMIECYLQKSIGFYMMHIKTNKINPLKTNILKKGTFDKYILYKAKTLNNTGNQIKYPVVIETNDDKKFLQSFIIK